MIFRTGALSCGTLNLMIDEPVEPCARTSGKYACVRCGWKWTPRPNRQDPPRACARCRTAYWNTAPETTRANRPDDPKWQAERDALENRRRTRQLARLKELTQELGADASAEVVKPTLLRPDAEELPLRGDELAKIILIDVADILSQDPRLFPQVSYCRLSYKVRVDLRIENAVHPDQGHCINNSQ
jgi:hypothetical protein